MLFQVFEMLAEIDRHTQHFQLGMFMQADKFGARAKLFHPRMSVAEPSLTANVKIFSEGDLVSRLVKCCFRNVVLQQIESCLCQVGCCIFATGQMPRVHDTQHKQEEESPHRNWTRKDYEGAV